MHTDPWPQDPSSIPNASAPVRRRRTPSVGVVAAILVATLGPTVDANDLVPDFAAERNGSARVAQVVDEPEPDRTAPYAGGIAARVRTGDGAAVPGGVLVLMGTPGSEVRARLYDSTPFTHRFGRHADTEASNDAARAVIEEVLGHHVPARAFTTPPGGGSSTGLPYAIAYLDLVTGGAFSDQVGVAATGGIDDVGYVHPVQAVDEKTAAAALAGADVLFTPSAPGHDQLDEHGARFVGELHRVRLSGRRLADERHLDRYREWGAARPAGMDVVGVRHLGDVAAYLCGAGSTFACDVEAAISDVVMGGDAAPPAIGSAGSRGSTTERR
jgi:hypothetical protein